MNWVLGAVILIVLICAIIGLKRGLIKSIYSIVAMIIALVITIFLSPLISKWMRSNETILNFFTTKVEETIHFDEEKGNSKNKEEIIDSLDLPEFLEKVLLDNNTSQTYNALAVQKDDTKKYITTSIACIVINAVAFVATFLLIRILLWLVGFLLDIVSKLPVIKQVNKLLGLILGIIQGFVYIWLFCILLMVFGFGEFGNYVYASISDSVVLTFIYNNNLILKVVTDFTKVIFG